MTERSRAFEYLADRNDNDIRIAAKARQRKHILADPGLVDALTYPIHRAGDFIPHDAGNLR